MAWRRSSGGHLIVGRPIALGAVALREEDIETKGLEPVREFEVEAPLGLREQWSCEVDPHASTRSGNQRGHRARLQDMMGIQFPQSEVVAGRLQYCLQRRQADELGRLYRGAEIGRRRANGFQGHRDGGLFEVGQVHRDLSLAADTEAERPYGRKAAAALPDLSGHRSCYLDVVCIQVRVESDQERTGADGDGPSVGVECPRPVIRLPQGVIEAGCDALVAAPPDVGEGSAVLGRRGRTVEEDRKSQGAQALAGPVCQPDGIIHRGAFQGHEGEYVEHAHPGVLPGLGGEVELGGARLREGDGALEHGVLLAGEREDAPVVVGV